MKLILSVILLFPLTIFSQEVNKVDKHRVKKFFAKVDRVEFCEIRKLRHVRYFYENSKEETGKIVDSLVFEEFETIIHHRTIDRTQIQKQQEISDSTIWQLKNILLTEHVLNGGRSLCYEPRNGICFYDKKNNLIAYLELCFTCDGFVWLNKPWNSEICNTQIQEIKQLFLAQEMKVYY